MSAGAPGPGSPSLINHYHIKQALPDIRDVRMAPSADALQTRQGVFLAGDYLLNGSLNAAMASGEIAAMELEKNLQ